MALLGTEDNMQVLITTQADTAGVSKTEDSLGGLEEKSKSLVGSFGQLTKAFLFGNILFSVTSDIAVRLKQGFSDVTNAAKSWQSTQEQLTAVLQSTHDAIGITSTQAIDLAESIQKITPVSRDSALQTENMLLTFTNLHKEVFPAATKAVIDMATAINGGATPSAEQLRNTAIQVGKALQDPATGMMTLRREGVNFTKAQTDMVKQWVASGDTLKAQNYIVAELAKEFGGSATAAAKTFGGQVQILKNNMIDLGVNALQKTASFLNSLWSWWQRNEAAIKSTATTILNLFWPSIRALFNTFKDDLLPALQKLYDALQPALTDVLKVLGVLIGTYLYAIFKIFTTELNVVWHLIADGINIIADIIGWLGNLGGAVFNAGKVIVNAFKAVWSTVSGDAKAVVDTIVDFFAQLPDRVIHAIGNIGSRIGNDIKGALHAIHIPGFATGVQNFAGGMAWVGENGPELISLPRGSNVYTNSQAQAMQAAPAGNNYNFGDIYLGDAGAVNQFARWMQQLNNDGLLASKGLTIRQGR